MCREGGRRGKWIIHKKHAREKVKGFSWKSFFADARVEICRARGHGCMNAGSGVVQYKGFWHWFNGEGRRILVRKTRGIFLENITDA